MASPYKLILTSDMLTNETLEAEWLKLLSGSTDGKTVWYLPTAPLRDGANPEAIKQRPSELKNKWNFHHVESIDVEHVQGKELVQAIRDLGHVDVIYADMGNTYALRHHLRESGGDQLLLEAMKKGAVYVGGSAGSIVAGKTIQTAFWKNWDDRTGAPRGAGPINPGQWDNIEKACGLDLAGGRSLFPHADGKYAEKSWQDDQARKHQHDDHEVVKLADGEGIVIDYAREGYEVTFSVQCTATQPGEAVFLVGSSPLLGAWHPENAVRLSPDPYPTWTSTVFDGFAEGQVEFKLIIGRESNSGCGVRWERGDNRCFEAKRTGPGVVFCLLWRN